MIPLSEEFVDRLRDPTIALAALMVISASNRNLLEWAAKTVGAVAPEPQPQAKPKARRVRKANGGRKPGVRDVYLERRRSQRDADDEALLAAMKASPGATIGDWSEAIHKSRTSTIAGLKRLRDRNLASNEDGVWALVEPEAPREPAAKWISPVSAAQAREHRAHATT
jgi:hypothetical protein